MNALSPLILGQIRSLFLQGFLPEEFSVCDIDGGNAPILSQIRRAFPRAQCVTIADMRDVLAGDPASPFDFVLWLNADRRSEFGDLGDHQRDLPRLAGAWFAKNARYTFVTATSREIWRLVQATFTVARLGHTGDHRTLVCFSLCGLSRTWSQRAVLYGVYVWACIRETYRQGGLSMLLRTLLEATCRRVVAHYYRFAPAPEFSFAGERYRYFRHPYNVTWSNERSVEVPLARALVRRHAGRRILEVGDVLWNYGPITHDVVDKYERRPGIINADVVDFRPDERYDLIVSISTLEHVGWDEEEPHEPERSISAFENLKNNCLARGGTLMITVPLGWNSDMDWYLRDGRIQFDEARYLKPDHAGRWREVEAADAWRAVENRPTTIQRVSPAIVVGIVRSP